MGTFNLRRRINLDTYITVSSTPLRAARRRMNYVTANRSYHSNLGAMTYVLERCS
ncbi:hypothetical protein BH24CHL1_BH24CHL1_16120 [soil metagenome]